MSDPAIEDWGWGIHSIITLDGSPYCVMQEWALYHSQQTYQGGAEALETMPTGEVKVVALKDMLTEENRREVVEDEL